jgi:hypothetical protein
MRKEIMGRCVIAIVKQVHYTPRSLGGVKTMSRFHEKEALNDFSFFGR